MPVRSCLLAIDNDHGDEGDEIMEAPIMRSVAKRGDGTRTD
jgi:hypothetical protein